MAPPRTAHHDDDELVRYLLGLLPVDAMERLDEASIADDEIAARLRTAETDLIDSYVRGQLRGAELERFESYYLSSPRRRDRVRAAASFIGAVDRSAARSEPVTWVGRIVRRTTFARMAAAAAIVTAIAGVLFLQAARDGRESTLATSGTGAVERPASEPASVPAPVPSGPLGGARAAPPEPEQIVAVVLPPPTRAVAPIPSVAVAAGADGVRFELELDASDFERYRVGLKDPATNRILWRSEWVAPSFSADRASITVVVPANLLGPRHYALDLTGRGVDGRAEVIGSYTVQVVQP